MKKILLASTALVAFAGAAAADVTISGNAEMGLVNTSGSNGNTNTGGDTEFFTDIDVTFTMSGETDNGLTFGASVDLDEGGDGSDASDNNREDGGATIFLSGAFGTVTMGDTDGALDWAMTEVAFNSGSLNDDETEHAGYNGNSGLDGVHDGQIVRYDYSFGDFGVALSAELDDDDVDSAALGIGFKYTADLGGTVLSFGLGYQSTEIKVGSTNAAAVGDHDLIGASLSATFDAFTVGVSYMDMDRPTLASSGDHVGVGVGYTTGAISLSANYGQYDYDDGTESDGYGLTAGYDLGGGAIVQVGYGDGDRRGVDGDSFSFGVRLNF